MLCLGANNMPLYLIFWIEKLLGPKDLLKVILVCSYSYFNSFCYGTDLFGIKLRNSCS